MKKTDTALRGKLVRLSAAAEQTGISVSTLRRYVTDGRLPAYRVGPRMLMVDPNDLNTLFRRIG